MINNTLWGWNINMSIPPHNLLCKSRKVPNSLLWMDGETWKANVLKDILASQNYLFLFSFMCVNFIFLNQLLYKGCLKQFSEKCLSSERSGSLLSFTSVMKFSISWIDLNHKKITLSQCFLCSLDNIKVWLNIFSIFTMLHSLGIQEKLLELLQIIFWKTFRSHHWVSINIFSLDKLFKTWKKTATEKFLSFRCFFLAFSWKGWVEKWSHLFMHPGFHSVLGNAAAERVFLLFCQLSWALPLLRLKRSFCFWC